MKKITSCLIFAALTFTLNAQPVIDWQRNYGGSNFEQPFGCEATHTGGIICGGHSISNNGVITSNQGDYDWWIIKLDSLGNIVFSKSYGGSQYDKCRYAFENPDGTIMAFGSVKSNNGDVSGNHLDSVNDYWFIKLDSIGNIIWQKCYGGTAMEGGRTAIRTSDGNYIVAGYSNSKDGDVIGNHGNYDVWLIKVSDANGSIIWQKCLGGTKQERVRSIYELANGDFIFTGNAESTNGDLAGTVNHGDEDIWTARINSTGTLIWSTQYGSTGQDRAYYCRPDLDGNVLVIGKNSASNGNVTNNHGSGDCWILKLNQNNGSIIWQKSFGGSNDDGGFRIDPLADGSYMVGATSESTDGDAVASKGNSDYWLFKIDSNRNILWQQNYGGPGFDHLNNLVKMNDGGYACIGMSTSKPNSNPALSDITHSYGSTDMWIVKISTCDTHPKLSASGSLTLYPGQTVTLTANSYQGNTYLWNTGATTASITASTGGNYFVTVTNTLFGCTGNSDTALVTTVSSCDFPLNITATNLSATSAKISWTALPGVVGYDVQYRVKGTTAWIKVSNLSNIANRNLTGLLAATVYQYRVRSRCLKDPNLYSGWSAVQIFATPAALRINSDENADGISIYPNPVSDKISVSFKNKSFDGTISIQDISGKTLQTQKIKSNENFFSVDIETVKLMDGIYFIQLNSNVETWHSKFIKKSESIK